MKPECFARAMKDADQEAFVHLYRSYWRSLYVSAYKVLGDQQASEDIIQDVFVQIWIIGKQRVGRTKLYLNISRQIAATF